MKSLTVQTASREGIGGIGPCAVTLAEAEGLQAHANAVREMFAGIATRYDFLNHFLSVNIDKRWRRLVRCSRGRWQVW